jgi:hypothetical protein
MAVPVQTEPDFVFGHAELVVNGPRLDDEIRQRIRTRYGRDAPRIHTEVTCFGSVQSSHGRKAS